MAFALSLWLSCQSLRYAEAYWWEERQARPVFGVDN